MEKKTLIIIGGGITGLVAARELSETHQVILLEAMRRFGGRICTLHKKMFPAAIEGGAEFIHGQASETIGLLKSAGIRFTKVGGKFYRRQNGVLKVQEDMVPGWDQLMQKMEVLEKDMTLNHFLSSYFNDDQFEELRAHVRSYAEGFDGADPAKVSVMALFKEWSSESDDFRINGGYYQLVKHLVADCRKKGCRLINGSIVKEINWTGGHVNVTTLDKLSYQADQCLITVPLSILQRKDLTFKPALDEYAEAAGKIGFGSVIKIVLSFKQRFWKKDAGFFFSNDTFSAWWTQLPSDAPILTGWSGGPEAHSLAKLSGGQLLEKAMKSLSSIFRVDEMRLKELLDGWHVFNWQKSNSIQGAYSYATPETSAALQILTKSVDRTLYFAGEGIYSGAHPGTVEAAIVSAKERVQAIVADAAGT